MLHILTKKEVCMESLWRKQEQQGRKKLLKNEDRMKRQNHWDVIVVGAGMTGVLTAYYLKKQGKSVLILEAGKIASGQTERTTAKITSQHGLKYHDMIRKIGKARAKLYAKANEEAITEYKKLIQELNISCHFEETMAYLYTCNDSKALGKEMEAAAELGIETVFSNEIELPFRVTGAVGFKNQAQFSPLEFMNGIIGEIDILEDTMVTEIKGNWVISKHGIMTADTIVIATHYPIKNIPGFYFLRQHQERSYVIALSGCTPIKNMYYGIDENGLSFRQAGNLLIVSGLSHRTGGKQESCVDKYKMLYDRMREIFPDCKVEAYWSAQDCMPHDGVPFIGRYSALTPNLYVASGFQKWGMTTAMIAARVLSDLICEKDNPYKKLFTPQRIYFRAGIKNFLIDIVESVWNLLLGIFSNKKCSHMGCKLVWNPTEQSWDCPCHGSRFGSTGELLDNPAQKDIKF